MRTIKFRGKRTSDGEWVYGYLMNMHNPKRLFIGKWENIGGEATIKDELFCSYKGVDPETVGQYTGLLDKNGKEIFEGDIVVGETDYEKEDDERQWTREKPAIVEWNNKIAGFYPFYLNSQWRCDVVNIKIIGNRFEHPELLEGKPA